MLKTSTELHANWDGACGSSRSLLLQTLTTHVCPSMMLPENRLATLLNQAQTYQQSTCLYHNTHLNPISLYTDHSCPRAAFPTTTTHILETHADEVWFVCFSNNGNYLATASRDAHAIIWETNTYTPLHILDAHKKSVSFLSFSPDDKMILTASNDCSLRLWNVTNGSLIRVFERHVEPVTSCVWLPASDRFVSGSLEKNMYIVYNN